MRNTKAVNSIDDIPEIYRNTPIGRLLEYHNLGRPYDEFTTAQLLVGMCMDNRKRIKAPDNFAFILRTGGANMRYSEFKISFAVAVGGVHHMALIGHTQCGMMRLPGLKAEFVRGMIDNAGWSEEQATQHYDENLDKFAIGEVTEFIASEVIRLRKRYPKIMIAPMLYKLEDNLLYFIEE